MVVSTEIMILALGIGWLILSAFILAISTGFDLSIFDPIRNYEEWTAFNWFGIVFISLSLNLIFVPYSVCYWVYRLFMKRRK